MTYSGLVADPKASLSPRGPFPLRLIVFTALAGGIGWAFTQYMPQINDLGWRVGLGIAMVISLFLLTTNVSYTRGERMFAALCFGAAFIVGMWGLWAYDLFGGLPTLDQIKAEAAGKVYNLQSFGEPFEVRGYIFEMWVGVTILFVSIPLLASLAKPRPAMVQQNPFDVHPDFVDGFMSRLIFLPLVSFAIAGIAVYLDPYMVEYGLPLQLVWIPPLAAGFIYAKLHMTFPRALLISILGGVGGAAGFWVPWLYMKDGQEGVIAFFQGTPQDILARAEELASGYTYLTEIYGNVSDYSPWAFEIWIGLTLTYLCLPLLITISRRFFYFVRVA